MRDGDAALGENQPQPSATNTWLTTAAVVWLLWPLPGEMAGTSDGQDAHPGSLTGPRGADAAVDGRLLESCALVPDGGTGGRHHY